MITPRNVLADYAKQLQAMGDKLTSEARPGHLDYISKVDAGKWAYSMATEIAELLRTGCEATLDREL